MGQLADPVKFVQSRNLRRRHLNASQRSLAAAKILEFYSGQAKERQTSNLKRGNEKPQNSPLGSFEPNGEGATQDSDFKGKAAEMAGRDFGLSRESVKRAKKVLDKGTEELQQAVEDGSLSVSKAADIADMPKEQQNEAIKQPPSKQKKPSEVEKLKARI